jgi:glycosyltransferase involved in cell wall biosynthesis
MGNQTPLVSIGLPVYNGENFVAEAIKCVLSQTFSDWELIISDNASTDRTVSICREFADRDRRIRVYENPRNRGVSHNYNLVFQLSRGRYFKWITHDDLFGAEFIESCLEELGKDDRTVLVFPKLVYVDAASRPLRQQTSDLSIIGLTPESRVSQLMGLESQNTDIFWSQFGLMRRNILEDTHLMDLYNGSDQTLLMEIALRGNSKQVARELFFRREHPAAATMRTGWTAKEQAKFWNADDRRRLVFPYFRMLKEHLACIRTSPISFRGKLQCTGAVLMRFRRQWKYFAHEIIDSPLEALGAK